MKPEKMIAFKAEDFYKLTGNGEMEGKNRAAHGFLLGDSWGGTKGNYVEYLFKNSIKFSKPILIIRYCQAYDKPSVFSISINGAKLPACKEFLHEFPPTGGWGHEDKEFKFFAIEKGVEFKQGLNSIRLTAEGDGKHLNPESVYIVEKADAGAILRLKTMEEVEQMVLPWPVSFDPATGIHHNSVLYSGVPLGGIGAGKVEVLPSGWFANITTNGNCDSPIRFSRSSFFAIQTEIKGKKTAKVLRLDSGREYENISNIRNIDYKGMFPHVSADYSDADLPVQVSATMFSPLIPQNNKDSSIPGATFRISLTNKKPSACAATVLFSYQNLNGCGGYRQLEGKKGDIIGWDCIQGNCIQPFASGRLNGVSLKTSQKQTGVRSNVIGEYAIAVDKKNGVSVDNYVWNDIGDDCSLIKNGKINSSCIMKGKSKPGIDGKQNFAGVVSATVQLKPNETREIDFYLSWYFPNYVTTYKGTNYGKFYSNQFKNSVQVIQYLQKNRKRLAKETEEWHRLIHQATIPFWLKYRIINGNFPLYSNTFFTKQGIFATAESPITMGGALGTMDQRMASHGFLSQMFTDLDKRELRSFSKCQRPDGRITHFTGNFHRVFDNPEVGYGVTDWPDLSCSWIMQIAKQFRFTNDVKFLKESWPRIKRNLAWMEKSDKDHDLVPEGGNTYDYEKFPGGMFIYNASCYLGALLTCIELARVLGDKATHKKLRERFPAVQESVIKHLWNGKFFMKWNDLATKTKNANSFIASLAGDWLARLIGVGATLDYRYVKSNIEYLLEYHLHKQKLVPPMEVDANGMPAVGASYVLQHEPYLGCEAIYAGYPDDGLEVIRRNFTAAWVKNHVGWNLPLNFNAVTNRAIMLFTYMTAPAAWHVFNALSGSTLDLGDKALYLHPAVFGKNTKIELPIWYPDFWLWLTYDKKKQQAIVKVIKVFKSDLSIDKIKKVTKEGLVLESKLKKPFAIKLNNSLTIAV